MFPIFALFLAQHFKYQKLCELFSHPGSPQGSIDNYISGPKGSNQHFLLETEIILLLYPDCPCSEIYQCFSENILDLIDHVNISWAYNSWLLSVKLSDGVPICV